MSDLEPRLWPGYVGMFSRSQAEGAIPNGQRVVKVRTEPGDAHALGEHATVLGSWHAPNLGYGYFVEWDTLRRCGVFVAGFKVAAAP